MFKPNSKNMNDKVIGNEVHALYGHIADLISQAKTRVAVMANTELTILYWNVGRSINEFVLDGNRAVYGKQIISNLSSLLSDNFGRGWGEKHIRHCLRIAETIWADVNKTN